MTFVLALVACLATPLRAQGSDTVPGRFGALALACSGTLDLRAVRWIDEDERRGIRVDWVRRGADDRLVSTFGPGPALVGALAMESLPAGALVSDRALRHRARVAAALAVALSAALLAFALAGSEKPARAGLGAMVAALSFAGTPTLGQALWQQTSALPFWCAAVATLAWAPRRPALLALTPALATIGMFLRPPLFAIALGLVAAWAIANRRAPSFRRAGIAVGLAIGVAVPLFLLNARLTGSPLPTSQLAANVAASGHALDGSPAHLASGLAGLLVSPARGLLWFAPVVVAGVVLAARGRDPLRLALLGAIAVHLVIAASFVKWWGGACFGPRLLGEIVWLAAWLAFASPPPRGLVSRVAVGASLAWTVAVGLLGSARDPRIWEVRRDADHDPTALWDVAHGPLPALIGSQEKVIIRDAPPGPFAYCVRGRAIE